MIGIDLAPWTAELLTASGGLGLVEAGADTTEQVLAWSGGHGADAIILTAATASSEPVRRATAIARDRPAVVGDVGLELERTPFYEKEPRLMFARSYGPGRYERSYEEWGVDYPLGYVRWTEGRNLQAYLDLVAAGRLSVRDLVTHRFPVEKAVDAYALVEGGERSLGIQLTYAPDAPVHEVVAVADKTVISGPGVGLVGAGTYARATLVPALKPAGLDRLVVVASAAGLSARHLAERAAAERAVSDIEPVLALPDVDLVVIATRHDSHADLVTRALQAGRQARREALIPQQTSGRAPARGLYAKVTAGGYRAPVILSALVKAGGIGRTCRFGLRSPRNSRGLTVHVAREASGCFVSVRFGNVLDSRGSVLTDFTGQVPAGGPVTVTDPEVTRYFMTVQEAVQLVIQAALVGEDGEVLVLDMGEAVRIDDGRRGGSSTSRPGRCRSSTPAFGRVRSCTRILSEPPRWTTDPGTTSSRKYRPRRWTQRSPGNSTHGRPRRTWLSSCI